MGDYRTLDFHMMPWQHGQDFISLCGRDALKKGAHDIGYTIAIHQLSSFRRSDTRFSGASFFRNLGALCCVPTSD